MNKYERWAAAAVALMLVAGAAIFFYAPTDYLQGPVQRIFYLHVSSAIAAYGCFAVVLVGGLIYLQRERRRRSLRPRGRARRRRLHHRDAGHGHAVGQADLEHVVDMGRAPDLNARAVDHLHGLPAGAPAR